MKGISPVIATILMLMITIALAGTAYLYISGAFQAQTQGIEVISADCTGNTVTFSVRNIGTTAISSLTCLQTAPSGDAVGNCQATAQTVTISIGPGTTSTFNDTCSGSGGRSCVYRITPPVGRSVQATAFCTG